MLNTLNNNSNNAILILAGGLGSRMNSNIPKVLNKVNNIPMIVHIINNAIKLDPYSILIVVGKYKKIIEETINLYIDKKYTNGIQYVLQENPNGTGHAVICSKKYLKLIRSKNILILSGDTPLIDDSLMINMLDNLINFKICTTILECPYGYGRIVHNNNEELKYTKIVEQKDCNRNEININHVNCGIYSIKIELLLKYLHMINNNNIQNEYYLTDLVEIITKRENLDIEIFKVDKNNNYKVLGVNTIEQLIEIEKYLIN